MVLLSVTVGVAASPALADRSIFADGFENARTVSDLLAPGRWSYVQQVNPGSAIGLSTTHMHSGLQSIRFFGHPSFRYRSITKADIAWSQGGFGTGDTIEIEAWFFLGAGADLNDLYLLDAECSECGTQSPGTRIRVSGGYPVVDRSKILGLPTISQDRVQVAVERWFDLRYRLKLGVGPAGHLRLWVDGTKVIDRAGTTVFPGGFVDSIQFGLTANASRADAEVFVDDVSIRRLGRPSPIDCVLGTAACLARRPSVIS